MTTIDKKEVYRYLGYRTRQRPIHSDDLDQCIDACIATLEKMAQPQSVYRTFPLTHSANTLTFGTITTNSQHLQKNLEGCESVYILAATLGIEVDRLIQRAEISNILDAAIYQAAGAAMIESYVDEINARIKEEARASGLFAHPRYSPGYGDFDLSYQKDVLSLVNATTIGIHLTDTFLMIPSKSVTAVIGCSSTDYACDITSCELCTQIDCTMRRE